MSTASGDHWWPAAAVATVGRDAAPGTTAALRPSAERGRFGVVDVGDGTDE